jgi:diguanylate cyclase (GGDEF)-like protein
MSISVLIHGTEHHTVADPNTPPSGWLTGRKLILDPWVLTASILTIVFLVFPDLEGPSLTTRSYIADSFSTLVLLGLAIAAVYQGVGSQKSERERFFWRLIGISLTAWLLGEVAALLFYDFESPFTLAAVDALYLCYYMAFALALDLQPQTADSRLQIRPLRVLGSAGRVLFLSGLFIYFVILPSTLRVDEFLTWVPSFSLYVVLDIYLVVRIAQEMRRASTSRSRQVYGLLLAAMLFALATDSLDLAWIASYLPDTFPRIADLCWYAPMILFVVAARIGPFANPSDAQTMPDNDDNQVRGVPLLVYSLGFALLHMVLSLIPHETGSLQFARFNLVMVWLVLFGILNVIQHSIIQREVRQQSKQREEAEKHILELSRQDPLTGLLNRRALEEELGRAVARANRSQMSLGLMFIDLDNFKEVNDTYGHPAGDSVLREAAARIKALTRDVDTVARYGGDEFVLVFEALDDPTGAEMVARRILDGFEMGFQFESGRINLSASIGIAIHPVNGRSPEKLFEAADRAMYAAKERGGSGIEFA